MKLTFSLLVLCLLVPNCAMYPSLQPLTVTPRSKVHFQNSADTADVICPNCLHEIRRAQQWPDYMTTIQELQKKVFTQTATCDDYVALAHETRSLIECRLDRSFSAEYLEIVKNLALAATLGAAHAYNRINCVFWRRDSHTLGAEFTFHITALGMVGAGLYAVYQTSNIIGEKRKIAKIKRFVANDDKICTGTFVLPSLNMISKVIKHLDENPSDGNDRIIDALYHDFEVLNQIPPVQPPQIQQ